MSDQAQSLREKVKKTGDNHQNASDMPRPPTKIISISSGKGGVGKSFLTVNLALALQQLGNKVLVVDADFGLANIDIMLGMPARYNLSHLISREHTMEEIVQEWQYGIKFISGGSGLSELLQMSDGQVDEMLEDLFLLSEPLDIILCDTGAGVNEAALRMITASTEVIIVTTPEPTAILDAYALLKTLSQNECPAQAKLIMNKSESQKEAENATKSFLGISKKYLNLRIEPLGSILYDDEVARSIKQQVPLLLSQPKSNTAKKIINIAATLADLPTKSTPGSQLSKLFSFWLKNE